MQANETMPHHIYSLIEAIPMAETANGPES